MALPILNLTEQETFECIKLVLADAFCDIEICTKHFARAAGKHDMLWCDTVIELLLGLSEQLKAVRQVIESSPLLSVSTEPQIP